MKIIVLFNPKSGSQNGSIEEFKETVSENLSEIDGSNINIVFKDITTSDFTAEYFKEERESIKAIVVAGGDGTISRSIKYAVESKIPLGIIPMGTFNNFASDNNIPSDLTNALNIIKDFKVSSIDVGKVGDKYFINNSSIGLYAESVLIRERTKKNYRLNKITAMILAFARIFYLFPMLYLDISVGKENFRKKTPFVFIGNNEYAFDLLSLGERSSLKGGKLFIYFTNCKYRFCLLKIGMKALFAKLKDENDFIFETGKQFEINSKKKIIRVAADGEIYKMKTPLTYKILQNSVELIVPEK